MMKLKIRLNAKISSLSILIIIYEIATITFPRSSNFLLILLYITAGVLLLYCIRNKYAIEKSRFLFLSFIALLISFYDVMMVGILSGINSFLRIITLYIPALFFYASERSMDDDTKKQNMTIVITLWVVLALLQSYLYISSPDSEYARGLASGTKEYFSFIRDAYGFCIGSMIISCTLYEKFLRLKTKKYIPLILVCTLVVFLTKSTIFIVVYTATIIYITIDSMIIQKRKHAFVDQILLLIAIIALVLLKNQIGAFCVDLSGQIAGIVGYRLKELGQLLVYGDLSDNVQSRLELYTVSFDSFLTHPILGSYIFSGGNISSIDGNHSEWLDTLGKYGLILGGGLLYWIWSNIYRCYKKSDAKMLSFILIIILAGFMNPISYFCSFFVILYIVPGINNNRF